jgi:hypothetical protein
MNEKLSILPTSSEKPFGMIRASRREWDELLSVVLLLLPLMTRLSTDDLKIINILIKAWGVMQRTCLSWSIPSCERVKINGKIIEKKFCNDLLLN